MIDPRFVDLVRALPPRARCGGTVALMCAALVHARHWTPEFGFIRNVPKPATHPIGVLVASGFTMAEVIEYGPEDVGIVRELGDLMPDCSTASPALDATPVDETGRWWDL